MAQICANMMRRTYDRKHKSNKKNTSSTITQTLDLHKISPRHVDHGNLLSTDTSPTKVDDQRDKLDRRWSFELTIPATIDDG